ncbi:hypothetical protein GQX74_004580 [Glossina fuscipes]|nr:hypothetical protein GQX74_004580 [Glossina fuscipes]
MCSLSVQWIAALVDPSGNCRLHNQDDDNDDDDDDDYDDDDDDGTDGHFQLYAASAITTTVVSMILPNVGFKFAKTFCYGNCWLILKTQDTELALTMPRNHQLIFTIIKRKPDRPVHGGSIN